jgi:hypothetical protein
VKVFTQSNPTWKTTPQLLKLLPRLDATRDWEPHEALALLDELAAIETSPISAAVEHNRLFAIRTGERLPKQLQNAPWGKPASNGLRMAWLLESTAAEHPLGTPLKSRLLFHNSGKKDVIFRTRNWHQSSQHKAQDANGTDIKVSSTNWLTRTQLVSFRLRPGEFVEVPAAGIGIGAKKNRKWWKGTRVGSWIEAKAGDHVKFQPTVVLLREFKKPSALIGEQSWWFGYVSARLDREKPVPVDDEVRHRLVYQVTQDLFGTPLEEKYTNAFLADKNPNALDTLARQLAKHPRLTVFTGELQSGPTTFRVRAAKE